LFKAIIIAGLLLSQSVFAAGAPGGGKARLKKLLACEASMMAGLSDDHQDLLSRLQNLFNKFEIVSLTVPDWLEQNMGMSAATFFAEMNSLAQQILNTQQPRPAAALNEILSGLESQMSRALTPPAPKPPRFSAAGKAAMETRMFGEDWSMPMGPHDFNQAPPKPADEQQQQQQQQRMRPLNPQPPPPPSYPFEGPGRFNPNWPPREKP
jgi:hypothetical protein